MNTKTTQRGGLLSHRRPGGFTLVELLVVIGILVILLSVLFPAAIAARNEAKRVAAKTQLNNLSSACEAYHSQMSAYPGYLADGVWESSANEKRLSGNENLVLSLMGQVGSGSVQLPKWKSGDPNKYVEPERVGAGPLSESGKLYAPFYSPQEGELLSIDSGSFSGDNKIPELLDRSTGVPLLYYRARRGGTLPVGSGAGENPVFLRRMHNMYVFSLDLVSSKGQLYDQRRNSLLSITAASGTANVLHNLATIAINHKLSENPSTPNHVDNIVGAGYLFIHPGNDGIYFHKAQNRTDSTTIPSHADLVEFDDVTYKGGT